MAVAGTGREKVEAIAVILLAGGGLLSLGLGLSEFSVLNPGIVLLIPVLYAGLRGGLRLGLPVLAGVLVIEALYLYWFGSAPASWGEYDLSRFMFFVVTAPLVVVLGASVRTESMARREAELERDLREARASLAEREKLAAMGALVNGVAHEMRTPLTALTNSLHLSRRRLAGASQEERARLEPLLKDALEAADRLNRLVGDLRGYTKGQGEGEVFDASYAVAEAVHLFGLAWPTGDRVELDLEPAGSVKGDRLGFHQIVINLLQNALDARPGGKVRIITRRRGERVEIAVRDEGPGLSPEVEARMFEEFFTTKREGVGLGLSIVRRIVEAHRGHLSWTTGAEGTTFVVELPGEPSQARPEPRTLAATT